MNTAVREMPEDDRPRERLARHGGEALRDAELIAVLFRTGTRDAGAVALAERLLRHFGDLRRVSQASIEELQQVKGVGEVKAIELKAALELGKRLAGYARPRAPIVRNASDLVPLLMHEFRQYETEHFKCVLLTMKNEVMKVVEISHGGLNGTMALPCDVFRQVVRDGAAALILAHNHPSGDPEPSTADVLLTKRLAEGALLLDIRLLDHVIFGDGRYLSMKERGFL